MRARLRGEAAFGIEHPGDEGFEPRPRLFRGDARLLAFLARFLGFAIARGRAQILEAFNRGGAQRLEPARFDDPCGEGKLRGERLSLRVARRRLAGLEIEKRRRAGRGLVDAVGAGAETERRAGDLERRAALALNDGGRADLAPSRVPVGEPDEGLARGGPRKGEMGLVKPVRGGMLRKQIV